MHPDVFKLTEDHIKLLRAMYVSWEYGDYENGVPCIDPKRPYGNKDVERDIADELGWELVESSDGETFLTKAQGDEAKKLHAQMEDALQIVLATGSFVPGTYRKTHSYDVQSWVLIDGPS